MAALLLASLYGAGLVRSSVAQVAEQLELALWAAREQDAETAARCASGAAALWEKQVPLLDALVQHDEIDGVSGALEELCCFADLHEPEEFLSRCARVLHDLRHIRELELPLAQNIL